MPATWYLPPSCTYLPGPAHPLIRHRLSCSQALSTFFLLTAIAWPLASSITSRVGPSTLPMVAVFAAWASLAGQEATGAVLVTQPLQSKPHRPCWSSPWSEKPQQLISTFTQMLASCPDRDFLYQKFGQAIQSSSGRRNQGIMVDSFHT